MLGWACVWNVLGANDAGMVCGGFPENSGQHDADDVAWLGSLTPQNLTGADDAWLA